MEILLFSANCVLPILLIMAAGYVLRRLRVVSAAFVAQANQFCFQVTLPIQLFCNIYRQQPPGWRRAVDWIRRRSGIGGSGAVVPAGARSGAG